MENPCWDFNQHGTVASCPPPPKKKQGTLKNGTTPSIHQVDATGFEHLPTPALSWAKNTATHIVLQRVSYPGHVSPTATLQHAITS